MEVCQNELLVIFYHFVDSFFQFVFILDHLFISSEPVGFVKFSLFFPHRLVEDLANTHKNSMKKTWDMMRNDKKMMKQTMKNI